tara:strand:+ start:429 stop:590 length:162 start_codon:yes stop_codon:yes gene_type:complete
MSVETMILLAMLGYQYLQNRKLARKIEKVNEMTILCVRNPVLARRILRKQSIK